jgi:RNA polymerase sigma-70 factor (ECF subfamily)
VNDPPHDVDLLRAHLDGDLDAFPTLVARHSKTLLAFVRHLPFPTPDAEDLVQEGWVRAWLAAPRFDPHGSGSLLGWLKTIVARLARDSRDRRLHRRAEWLTDVDLDREDPARGPDAVAEAHELADRVHAAYAKLEPHHARAITDFLVDRPTEDIADELGISVRSAQSRRRRAFAEMAVLL